VSANAGAASPARGVVVANVSNGDPPFGAGAGAGADADADADAGACTGALGELEHAKASRAAATAL
jgi:hypothetical protein